MHDSQPKPVPLSAATKPSADTFIPLTITAAIVLLHILTNGRYGFHRDELQTLSDAMHMDWGFVAYPPLTPFVERISLQIFGLSMIWLRMASVVAQAIVIIVTGLMARELGGGRLAQATAALSVALAPLALFEGTEFQYTTFDFLWWVLIAYFVLRLLKSENPRWCVPIGITIGLGFMTKYTMGFYVAGILGGLLLTWARRFVASKWFWIGIALAVFICLPNVIWQIHHDFISLHFLQRIHARDVAAGRAQGFISYQFWLCTNSFTIPLWIAGLIYFFRGQRYRMIAWMFTIPFLLFVISRARFYYVGAAYPMLLAMGAVMGERWLRSLSQGWRWTVQIAFFSGVVLYGAVMAAVLIPLAPTGPLRQFALKNNGDLREEIGWPELVQSVASVRDSLSPDRRANLGIVVGNYGEGGALAIFGPAYHLPPPIQLTNSGWLRGYPAPPPSTLIVLGWTQDQVDEAFTSCKVVGQIKNSEGVKNEESRDHPDFFLCGPPKQTWPEFWKTHQRFG
ncbi:MAG TPA: glycosyltransferase family 39 protein [Candidatus Sulfotelmatobacter sp.]|nr:glycosyltransferase family 39 protein [Candidatus Sulfotelmatobacter sp.]